MCLVLFYSRILIIHEQVVDFSEAEHAGFVDAFIDFWRREGSIRTTDNLRASAEGLLKGCQQHFRAGVTRIKRIGGVIPLGQGSNFEKMAHGLLKLTDREAFDKHASALLSKFPQISPWLEWWLRDAHARMLFTPYRRMDPSLWASIPDTTNAEEAMHWKLYSGIGQDKTLMDGLAALYSFAGHYERLLAGAERESLSYKIMPTHQYVVLVGTPIRYGQAEPWKQTFKRIGRTKASRDPKQRTHRYHNDGRPPDTTNTLLVRGKKRRDAVLQKLTKKLAASQLLMGPPKVQAVSTTDVCHPAATAPIETRPSSGSIHPVDNICGLGDPGQDAPTLPSLPIPHSVMPHSESEFVSSVPPPTVLPPPGLSSLRSIPCYPYANNSCWLDVALQVLHVSASIDFHSFEERFSGVVPPNTLLHLLYNCLALRRAVQSETGGQNNNPSYLSIQRDTFRRHLYEHDQPKSILKSLNSQENVFVSISDTIVPVRQLNINLERHG